MYLFSYKEKGEVEGKKKQKKNVAQEKVIFGALNDRREFLY